MDSLLPAYWNASTEKYSQRRMARTQPGIKQPEDAGPLGDEALKAKGEAENRRRKPG